MPALVGQEDPELDTGSPAAQPDVFEPLAQGVEPHVPPEQEVVQHEPLTHGVESHEDRSLHFSDISDEELHKQHGRRRMRLMRKIL